jgi:Na+-translocating ferredoxin:NAD+ oxidoreductase RnfC subunit
VRILLKQHAGKAAQPVVRTGARVEPGTVVGRAPQGELGADVHASIGGTVRQVMEEFVEIEA